MKYASEIAAEVVYDGPVDPARVVPCSTCSAVGAIAHHRNSYLPVLYVACFDCDGTGWLRTPVQSQWTPAPGQDVLAA
jgi:hypothetical protein